MRIEFRHHVPASLMRYHAISTGVYSGLPSPSGGDCRVMITAYYKPTFAPFVNTNGERHLLSVAAITANLARVSRNNSFKRPASIFSFAFRQREKASPSHVTDRLGEMAILDYPAVERSPCALGWLRRSPSGAAHSFIVPPGQIHYTTWRK